MENVEVSAVCYSLEKKKDPKLKQSNPDLGLKY